MNNKFAQAIFRYGLAPLALSLILASNLLITQLWVSVLVSLLGAAALALYYYTKGMYDGILYTAQQYKLANEKNLNDIINDLASDMKSNPNNYPSA
jgi:hypothetical protein